MSAPLVLAVDGGNSKTDLALVRADGEALALVRGPQSSPHHLGVDGCVRVLEQLLADALREAGLGNETTLEQAVPRFFGLETPTQLAEAFHRRRIPLARMTELAPVVLAEARSDAVAAGGLPPPPPPSRPPL